MEDNDLVVSSGVEEAPDVVDLDVLLGISTSEIDSMSDDTSSSTKSNKVSFDSMSEDNVEVEEPHIKIPTKRLQEILGISSQIASAGENSFEGKVVTMKVEKGVVRFLLSDNKRNVERDVELLNTDNQFEGFVAFSTSLLSRLSKVCTSIFTLVERKEDGTDKKKYVLLIRGGEIALDNINMQEEKFNREIVCDSDIKYNKSDIEKSIKRLYSFASTSVRSGKSVDFVDNIIQASPINSLAKITLDTVFPTFKLSLNDAKLLLAMCSFDDSDSIKISSDGKVFVGNTFKFKTESYAVANNSFDTVAERMFDGEYAEIDAQHLIQITELSVGLDTSTGNMRFNYTDNGFVSCELLTKRENSKLTIQGNRNENLVVMESDVEVPSYNLKSALTIFSGESVMRMRVTPDGLALCSGNVKVAILGKVSGK